MAAPVAPARLARGLLCAETFALPIDLFRVLIGLLAFAHFVSLLLQAGDFTNPDGLLDHALIGRIYWYARLSLFQPGMPAGLLYAALSAGCALALGLTLGWRPKLCAAALFLLAVSAGRWNFLVMHVDDTAIQIMLFWLLLLPIGRSLVLEDALARPDSYWEEWKAARVPAGAAIFLTWSVCVAWWVAAGWKLSSPYWRGGFALYATLKLPFVACADFWGPGSLPLLRAANYAALAVELALPVLLTRAKGSRLKWAGLAGLFLLHGGIALLLPFAAANLAVLATAALFFRDELMAGAGEIPSSPEEARRPDAGAAAGGVLLIVLTLSVLRDIPVLGALSGPATGALWLLGVYEDYRLFDWIDEKNYAGRAVVLRQAAGEAPREVDAAALLPPSVRHGILAGYLFGDIVHGSLWIWVPYRERPALRNSILHRTARRICSLDPESSAYAVAADWQRITPENADLSRPERSFLMDFRCEGGLPERCRTLVDPRVVADCR